MEHIRQYLLSVTTAAMLCGILQSILGQKGTAAGLLRLLCGIFLVLTVMGPFAHIQLRDISWNVSNVTADAQTVVDEGTDYARRALERHIKEQAQAYILDKAHAYEAQVTAEVRVSAGEPPVPTGCTIQGNLSAFAKKQLSAIIEADLGIPEEEQIWITSSSSS